MFLGLNRRIWFLISNLFGFGILIWSAQDYFELMRGDRIDGSFCNINAYWNCDIASLSFAGSWFSIPVGIFGAFWFFTISIISLSSYRAQNLLRAVLSLGGLLTLGMASYLIFVLKVGCVVCFSSYIFVILSICIGWNLKDQSEVFKKKSLLIAFIVGLIILGLFTLWGRSRINERISENEFKKWFQLVESVPVVSPLQKGVEGAPITVVEFSDFGCPFCARAGDVIIPFLVQQKDIRFVFFPFPLDSACNRSMDSAMHPYSCDWSKAVICANEDNLGWKMHDRLFEYTKKYSALPDPKKSIADLGFDQEKILKCMDDPTTNETLKRLVEVGLSMRIQRTPTFFISGRRFEGVVPMPLVNRVLEELRR